MQNKTDIDRGLRQRAEAGEIPGVVAVAADSNGVIYEGAFGKRDLGRDDPMTTDSRSARFSPILPRRRCWTASTPMASRSCGRPGPRSPCAI